MRRTSDSVDVVIDLIIRLRHARTIKIILKMLCHHRQFLLESTATKVGKPAESVNTVSTSYSLIAMTGLFNYLFEV